MTAGNEGSAVQIDGRHGHDVAGLHFVLEKRAVNHSDGNVRIQDRHQVERLHNVGAVMARERHVDLEVVLALEAADALKKVRILFARIAARLKHGEDEGREFMAHRERGKAHAHFFTGAAYREARTANLGADVFGGKSDLARNRGDILQEGLNLAGFGRTIRSNGERDRAGETVKIALDLLESGGIKHFYRTLTNQKNEGY